MFARTPPDTIEQTSAGNYVFTYAEGRLLARCLLVPITSFYSPNACVNKWYVVCYRILSNHMNAIAAHKERELSTDEITYFERLIKNRRSVGEVAPTSIQ